MKKYSFRIYNNFTAVSELSKAIKSLLEKSAVTTDAVYAVMLVVEEMTTNIIKYGYDDESSHEIEVELRMTPDAIILTTIDDGHEFDPLSVEATDISANLDARAVGGMGIMLARSMSDSMKYFRQKNRNILQIKVNPRK